MTLWRTTRKSLKILTAGSKIDLLYEKEVGKDLKEKGSCAAAGKSKQGLGNVFAGLTGGLGGGIAKALAGDKQACQGAMECASAINSSEVMQGIQQQYAAKVEAGETLTDRERSELFAIAKELYTAADMQQRQQDQELYLALAEKGKDPEALMKDWVKAEHADDFVQRQLTKAYGAPNEQSSKYDQPDPIPTEKSEVEDQPMNLPNIPAEKAKPKKSLADFDMEEM